MADLIDRYVDWRNNIGDRASEAIDTTVNAYTDWRDRQMGVDRPHLEQVYKRISQTHTPEEAAIDKYAIAPALQRAFTGKSLREMDSEQRIRRRAELQGEFNQNRLKYESLRPRTPGEVPNYQGGGRIKRRKGDRQWVDQHGIGPGQYESIGSEPQPGHGYQRPEDDPERITQEDWDAMNREHEAWKAGGKQGPTPSFKSAPNFDNDYPDRPGGIPRDHYEQWRLRGEVPTMAAGGQVASNATHSAIDQAGGYSYRAGGKVRVKLRKFTRKFPKKYQHGGGVELGPNDPRWFPRDKPERDPRFPWIIEGDEEFINPPKTLPGQEEERRGNLLHEPRRLPRQQPPIYTPPEKGVIMRFDDGGSATPDNAPDNDMTAHWNTQLDPQQEAEFQRWAQRYGVLKDLYDYDMRGAYMSGIRPGPDGHWPDTYKKPNHPTFSDESQYHGMEGNYGGRWGYDETGSQTLQPYDRRRDPQALERTVNEATQFVDLQRAGVGLGEQTNQLDVVDRLRHPTYQQLADDKDLRRGRTRMAPRGRGAEGGFGYQRGGAVTPEVPSGPSGHRVVTNATSRPPKTARALATSRRRSVLK